MATHLGPGLPRKRLTRWGRGSVAAKDPIREWVASNLGDLLPDAPEAVSGQVLLHALVHEQEQRSGSERALYVVIRQ